MRIYEKYCILTSFLRKRCLIFVIFWYNVEVKIREDDLTTANNLQYIAYIPKERL